MNKTMKNNEKTMKNKENQWKGAKEVILFGQAVASCLVPRLMERVEVPQNRNIQRRFGIENLLQEALEASGSPLQVAFQFTKLKKHLTRCP